MIISFFIFFWSVIFNPYAKFIFSLLSGASAPLSLPQPLKQLGKLFQGDKFVNEEIATGGSRITSHQMKVNDFAKRYAGMTNSDNKVKNSFNIYDSFKVYGQNEVLFMSFQGEGATPEETNQKDTSKMSPIVSNSSQQSTNK